nr:hypothetical protein CFP56_78024 [Quercus suber]
MWQACEAMSLPDETMALVHGRDRRIFPWRSRSTSQIPFRQHLEPKHRPPTLTYGSLIVSSSSCPHQYGLTLIDLENLAPRSFPFYTSRSLIQMWWLFARDDDALFNVVLLSSARDLDSLQKVDSIRTRELLTHCLSLLRKRLNRLDAAEYDHMAVAVAMLAGIAYEQGDMRVLRMHLSGLKRMVEARGGLSAMRDRSALASNMVFWYALVAINEPSLLPVTYGFSDAEVHQPPHTDMTTSPVFGDASAPQSVELGIDLATADMLEEVRRVSGIYTSLLRHDAPREAMEVFHSIFSVSERLMRYAGKPSAAALSQSCCIAACLHILTPISAYSPSPTLLLHAMVRELKASTSRAMELSSNASKTLLWLLAVGGITAHSMPERSWFLGHLAVVVNDLNIQTWDEMRTVLLELVLHDDFCDVSYRELWTGLAQKLEPSSTTPE